MIGIRNLNVFGSLDRPSNQSVCQHPQLTTWWVISVALKISIVALNGNMSKKCYKWNKKCFWTKSVTQRTKFFRNGLIRPSTASSDLLWYCMAFYGLEWFLWHIVVLFGLLYGLLWPFMAKYRIDLTSIVFSRGHRSKFIWSCLW